MAHSAIFPFALSFHLVSLKIRFFPVTIPVMSTLLIPPLNWAKTAATGAESIWFLKHQTLHEFYLLTVSANWAGRDSVCLALVSVDDKIRTIIRPKFYFIIKIPNCSWYSEAQSWSSPRLSRTSELLDHFWKQRDLKIYFLTISFSNVHFSLVVWLRSCDSQEQIQPNRSFRDVQLRAVDFPWVECECDRKSCHIHSIMKKWTCSYFGTLNFLNSELRTVSVNSFIFICVNWTVS